MGEVHIVTGPIGAGKSHYIKQHYKHIRRFTVENKADFEKYLAPLISYSAKRTVVFDIWARRKLDLSKYTKTLRALPPTIVFEVRDEKHSMPLGKKTTITFNIERATAVLEKHGIKTHPRNWWHVKQLIETHRYSNPPEHNPFIPPIPPEELHKIPSPSVALPAVVWERTRAKPILSILSEVLCGDVEDTCLACGQFRSAHRTTKTPPHPFMGGV